MISILCLLLEWPEMIDNVPSSSPSTPEQIMPINNDKLSDAASSSLPSLSNFDEETKMRILTLLKELGENETSSSEIDNSSRTKLAFVGKNLYVCSTCTGPVQWV